MISNPYTDQNQLYIALGYCGLMLFIAWLLKKYPPKKINHLYGYRTKRSMKSQFTWDSANKYSALIFFKICLYSFLIPVALYFLYPQLNVLITIVTNWQPITHLFMHALVYECLEFGSLLYPKYLECLSFQTLRSLQR